MKYLKIIINLNLKNRAIKDSMDIVFIIWAISTGIANGAEYVKCLLLDHFLLELS